MSAEPPWTQRMERNLRLLPWWWVLRWVWLGEAIWVIYLVEERGLTVGQVVLFEAVFSAVIVAAEVPTGVIADRYGRRPVLLAASLLFAGAFVTFGLARGIALLLGSYALWGVGVALMSGADHAFLFDTLKLLGRGEEFARRVGRMDAVAAVISAGVMLVGAAMALWTPLAVPIVLSSGFAAAAVLVGWRLVEPPRTIGAASFGGTAAGAARRVIGDRALLLVVALAATMAIAAGVAFITFQPLARGYGAPVWTLGGFAVAMTLSSAAGSWSAARIGRVLGFGRALGVLAAVGTLALLGGASGVPWLFPLFALVATANAAAYPLVADYLSRRASDDQRATVLSMNSVAAQIGNIAVAPAVALTIDRSGLHVALLGAALVLFAFSVPAYLLWARRGDTRLAPNV